MNRLLWSVTHPIQFVKIAIHSLQATLGGNKQASRPELGKWTTRFYWGYSPLYGDPFVRTLSFGIFKVTSYPPEGRKLTKKHYKGFLLTYNIRLLIVREK